MADLKASSKILRQATLGFRAHSAAVPGPYPPYTQGPYVSGPHPWETQKLDPILGRSTARMQGRPPNDFSKGTVVPLLIYTINCCLHPAQICSFIWVKNWRGTVFLHYSPLLDPVPQHPDSESQAASGLRMGVGSHPSATTIHIRAWPLRMTLSPIQHQAPDSSPFP